MSFERHSARHPSGPLPQRLFLIGSRSAEFGNTLVEVRLDLELVVRREPGQDCEAGCVEPLFEGRDGPRDDMLAAAILLASIRHRLCEQVSLVGRREIARGERGHPEGYREKAAVRRDVPGAGCERISACGSSGRFMTTCWKDCPRRAPRPSAAIGRTSCSRTRSGRTPRAGAPPTLRHHCEVDAARPRRKRRPRILFFGSGTRIRTLTGETRIRCPTIRRSPKVFERAKMIASPCGVKGGCIPRPCVSLIPRTAQNPLDGWSDCGRASWDSPWSQRVVQGPPVGPTRFRPNVTRCQQPTLARARSSGRCRRATRVSPVWRSGPMAR